jgi:serine protease Do
MNQIGQFTKNLRWVIQFVMTGICIGFVLMACDNAATHQTDHSENAPAGIHQLSADAAPATEIMPADVQLVPKSFSSVAEMAIPAVVNIRIIKTAKSSGRSFRDFQREPFGKDDGIKEFFKRFFGQHPDRDFRPRSLGSGFVIDKAGYVVTNNHVLEDADTIQVILKDEKVYEAKIIGRDANTDIALIKIQSDEDLAVLKIGDSDALKVGQWVVAIGNPFGLQHTVTAGIVSAKGRIIKSGPYDDYIQTDASINPGNSGGPLLNMNGEVIGINTMIFAGGNGIGFAIPVNMANDIVAQLKESGEVTRGWLGVSIQDVPNDLAEYLDIQGHKGAMVADVVPGDPADKAGIQPKDIIVEVQGQKVEDSRELLRLVAGLDVGESVKVKVLRNGKPRNFRVKVAKRR